ncbi:hypothetical protein [Methylorubrum thiocyanatum]|uniref:hypothetical protein n=1 Tax=Methylorubrum thiocyanatum TaxID=47958 RepID=UPI00364F6526
MTILSGSGFHPHGTKIDGRGTEGGRLRLPPRKKMPYALGTTRAAAVLQVNGNGPFSADDTDPAETLSKAKT